MKRNAISKHLFDPAQVAAVVAAASDAPVDDADNPATQAADWDHAVVSRSLPEFRAKLAERFPEYPSPLMPAEPGPSSSTR